jgi:hypothetical protein
MSVALREGFERPERWSERLANECFRSSYSVLLQLCVCDERT